jgi:hypothetical protein
MKQGRGMKDRDERSRGMEILISVVVISESLSKIKPTEPFRLFKTMIIQDLFFQDKGLEHSQT